MLEEETEGKQSGNQTVRQVDRGPPMRMLCRRSACGTSGFRMALLRSASSTRRQAVSRGRFMMQLEAWCVNGVQQSLCNVWSRSGQAVGRDGRGHHQV